MTLYVGGSVLIPYILQMGVPKDVYADQIEQIMNILNTAIMTVPLLAMLCAICMFITCFQDRKRELAIYLSIGMEIKMLYKVLTLEWIYRGIFLFLQGLLGAYALNFAIYCVFVVADVVEYLINPFEQILFALLTVILLCAVMTCIMISKIRRTNIAEMLKMIS